MANLRWRVILSARHFQPNDPQLFTIPAKMSTQSNFTQKNKVRALNELSNELRINEIGRIVSELSPLAVWERNWDDRH